jgi:hypothetical protein
LSLDEFYKQFSETETQLRTVWKDKNFPEAERILQQELESYQSLSEADRQEKVMVKSYIWYMSSGAAAVFQVSGSNPRKRLRSNCVPTNILFLWNGNL